jgi:hypothetical protein
VRSENGLLPEVTEKEVMEAALAVAAAKETEAEHEVLDGPAVGTGGLH